MSDLEITRLVIVSANDEIPHEYSTSRHRRHVAAHRFVSQQKRQIILPFFLTKILHFKVVLDRSEEAGVLKRVIEIVPHIDDIVEMAKLACSDLKI